MQVGMAFISESLAGALFPGNPAAVLVCMTYGRQILEQILNLMSDYKFGFYMKIPETEMSIAQVHGTLIGPFVNYGVIRVMLDTVGAEVLKGEKGEGNAWLALKTRNNYGVVCRCCGGCWVPRHSSRQGLSMGGFAGRFWLGRCWLGWCMRCIVGSPSGSWR